MPINLIENLCSSLPGLRAGGLAGAQSGNRRGRATSVARLAAKLRPVIARLALLLALCAPFFAVALLPQPATAANTGNKIVNLATFRSDEFPAMTSAVTVTTVARTKSTIEFLKYAPGAAGAIGTPVATTSFGNAQGNLTPLAAPVPIGSTTPIDLSAPVQLLPYSIFHAGEPVFVQVTDPDQILDPTTRETVLVTVSDQTTGDSETLQLTETGPNTGVFVGYLQTTAATGVPNDGLLSVATDSVITAQYSDIADPSDTSSTTALVDPFGIIFDTLTGKPVDGVKVELLNANGTPATVLGDDGVSGNIFPNSVLSGSTATDSGGKIYSFNPGGYRFPFVAPGNYILRITPSDTYSSPSTLSTARIQSLYGTQFTVLGDGSYGKAFSVPVGPALRIDIPIDPKVGTLWISKVAGSSVVSAGEYLTYDITAENTDPVGTVFSAVITDRLPPGFRYRKGSARLNGLAMNDPTISPDGSTLTFAAGNIAAKTSTLIHYVAGVGAGAVPGTAVNTASGAATPPVSSNTATASVTVQEPFMQSSNIVMGRVVVGACGDNIEDQKKGMEGIGIYLEDGTFVVTDKRGMFHLEGVRSGTHVVQLDLDSIPEGYQVLPCEQNSRFAGRAYSQFVDLQGGTMWRTDFHLGKTKLAALTAEEMTLTRIARGQSSEAAPQPQGAGQKADAPAGASYKGEISIEMISSQSGDFIDYRIPLQAATVPLTNLILAIALPPGAIYHKGSSNLDGLALPDPEVAANSLSYKIGAAGSDWHKELRFRVSINPRTKGGELQTKAALTFDSPTAKGVLAPEVDNLLSLVKEESRVSLPPIVLHPHYPTFGAELSEEDRRQLNDLVMVLKRFKIDRIDTTGHTDIVRIAPRSRKVYADNTALSFARARSVGRYLAAALHLPPESLNLDGKGEHQPVASNRTVSGRASNRRVEVHVLLSQEIETSRLKIVKERSGVKKQETNGGSIRLSPAEQSGLLPLQPAHENLVISSRASGALAAADNAPPVPLPPGGPQAKGAPPATVAGEQKVAAPAKSAAPKKDAAAAPAAQEPHAELYSALSEGVVNYRLKLVGVKGALKRVTATLVTPKSFLYLTGTSRLSGSPLPDPETKESLITYNIASLPDGKFDLRLQSIIDGDDQAEALKSSVTVSIADGDGKPLKTYTATAELSDNMEEVNRPDIPVTEVQPIQEKKSDAENVNEYTEKVTPKGGTGKAEAAKPEAGLHVTGIEGFLSPADGTVIASQINAVRLILNSDLRAVLTLDGKEIPDDRVGFKMQDKENSKSLYTYIGVDFGEPGEHTLQLKGIDPYGVARFDKSAKVIRTGAIASIKLISAAGNIADGKTPVKVRVQLFDKDDKPIMANAELSLKGGTLRPVSESENMGRDSGAAMAAVDGQGWIKFQPVTVSGMYRVQLAYNKVVIDIETYVKPVMRNWILVGLAEGTAGYNTAAGHMENLKASGAEDQFYDKERVAFYAKGTVKGEWLLTMSYDSAKQGTGVSGNALFQNIDPNAFYTLYGDSTTQAYDASSQRKLYLKVERDQFYAMFGDYDTGLTVTELSRYSRRLNGIKTEFHSKDYELTAFGSETGQSFAKDELPGDGTSGLYRLNRPGIVINSETVTIESHDRFHSETVTDSRPMTRFIDYSIDYDAGTIFFKAPVASRDDQLNPVYIVVDYEVGNAGGNALTYGGRAGTKLMDGKLQVGGSYVHEGQVSGANNLYGADAAMNLGSGTKARAEFAASNNESGLLKTSGNAYLAEVTHSDKVFDAKAYFREQDAGFGLGQQSGTETGTRKFGAEGAYKLSSSTALNAQAYQQDNLAGGNLRDFAELIGSYNDKDRGLTTRGGVRYAIDTLADSSHAESLLGTVGVSWKTLGQRLTLRADHDQALFSRNNNTDFPTKTTLGADFAATKAVTLFAQEELTYGSAAKNNTTRAGVKATPWSGGTLSSSVGNDTTENTDRTFATVGLAQKWQVTPRWTVDGGLDRNQTITNKTGYQFNINVPPAVGGEDFTAVSLGANFLEKKLTWSNRVEYRTGSTDKKWGIITGVMNEQGLYWGWTGKLQVLHSEATGGVDNTDVDIRMGLAYRPPVTRWILLDRLDLVSNDDSSAGVLTRGKRIINNLNANFRPNQKTQLSLQYGAKYVLQQIDATDYSGYTDLVGIEGRYDLTKDLDFGLRASILHTWELRQMSYSFGPSVGYNVVENAWLSLGYNLIGFKDRDFSAANFTTQGPYVQFRVKFDQNSVKDGLKALNQ